GRRHDRRQRRHLRRQPPSSRPRMRYPLPRCRVHGGDGASAVRGTGRAEGRPGRRLRRRHSRARRGSQREADGGQRQGRLRSGRGRRRGHALTLTLSHGERGLRSTSVLVIRLPKISHDPAQWAPPPFVGEGVGGGGRPPPPPTTQPPLYPLIPDMTTPRTKERWPMKNRIRIGTIIMTDIANRM